MSSHADSAAPRVTTYRADWLLPIVDDPVQSGWVTLQDGVITATGGTADAGAPADAIDLGRTVILPALVNAHTHLELSYLRGRVPAAGSFIDWIRPLMAARREHPDPADDLIVTAAREAMAGARAAGVGLFGDISNTLVTVPLLREVAMPAQVFFEVLGFNEAHADQRIAAARTRLAAVAHEQAARRGVRVSMAPHAPYSVSPALLEAIRRDLDSHDRSVSTIHVGESTEELELLRRGTGPFRTLLEDLGVWTDEWQPPGTSPVEYLIDLGFLDPSVIAVHGVQFDGEDLTRLSALGVTVVSCPRSNQHVGVGPPPLEAFYAMDVDTAFGTDSLASSPDLSIFAELAEARRLAPRVPARRLLESATLVGARALGFGDELGSIERGKEAHLIAVGIPGHIKDVEEYLVSGIEPAAVTWLESHPT